MGTAGTQGIVRLNRRISQLHLELVGTDEEPVNFAGSDGITHPVQGVEDSVPSTGRDRHILELQKIVRTP